MTEASSLTSFELVKTFDHSSFCWFHDPTIGATEESSSSGETPGTGGGYSLTPQSLTLSPPAFRDFWSKTFYTPTLIKHDASALLRKVAETQECTIMIDFDYTPVSQFDQAGLMVYRDDLHWVKAGIEFCDGAPRLSVVVTNDYSDWSTQPWNCTGARLRLHKINHASTIVVEACPLGSSDYSFIRIAHLSCSHNEKSEKEWQVGPYAACPMQQKGCVATFSNLEFGPRIAAVHSTDSSTMVK